MKAESTIYIRADGSVEGTDKIQRDGDGYTFLGDISIDGSGIDCIVVERDNIIVDGAGYTLEGAGGKVLVFYTDIDGDPGHGYYYLPDQRLRLWFGHNKLTAIYVTRSDWREAVRISLPSAGE